MRKILIVVLVAILANCAFAEDGPAVLALEITVDHGVIKGFVRNRTGKRIRTNAHHLYGHWERTTVLYLYGRWREAPLVDKARAHFGALPRPVEVELVPGQLLLAPNGQLLLAPNRGAECTFTIDLSEYALPKNFWDVSKLRVVTCGLWSNIKEIKTPRKALKTPR